MDQRHNETERSQRKNIDKQEIPDIPLPHAQMVLQPLDRRNIDYPEPQFQDYQSNRPYISSPYIDNRITIQQQPNVYTYHDVETMDNSQQEYQSDRMYFVEKTSPGKRPLEKHIVPRNLSDIYVQSKRPKAEELYTRDYEEIPFNPQGEFYTYEMQQPLSQTMDPSQGTYFSIAVNPAQHQVKEFNLLPSPVLTINREPSTSDYIVVYLIPDIRMNTEPIFLAAQSAKFCKDKKIQFDNLKVTNKMLKGRTKGYKFYLRYDYYSKFSHIERLESEWFSIWTNVNQKGFPRETRDSYLKNQWKDTKYPIGPD